MNSKCLYQSLGAIHIHSLYSDGSGDIYAITKSAKHAGLDWIIITDHNNMDIQEGFIDGICVIKGEEISPENNHYLVLGTKSLISENKSPKEYIQEVKSKGGFGFAAHPDEACDRKNIYKPIRWIDKNVIPDGIEIWNWFSTWADGYCDKNIFTQAYAYFCRHKLIAPPKSETLTWWDNLNNSSDDIVPAIGGIDAHALKYRLLPYIPLSLKIFPYQDSFNTITNVISLENNLSSDFNVAKKQILNALKTGKNIIVNRKICKKIPIVDIIYDISKSEKAKMHIKIPKKMSVRLLCNGKSIWSGVIKEVFIPLETSGKYRVEISTGSLGYAYTNPIKVEL